MATNTTRPGTGAFGRLHPTERGEQYVNVMRGLAETMTDGSIFDLHLDELSRLIRPLSRMSAYDLNLVLEGIHDALQDLLNELVADRLHA